MNKKDFFSQAFVNPFGCIGKYDFVIFSF